MRAQKPTTSPTTSTDARCRLRPGEACRLCQPGATGPDDCPAVYLVMTDDDLRAGLERVLRGGIPGTCEAEGPSAL